MTDDWDVLAEFRRFLEPFQLRTKITEGKTNSIELVLPTMDYAMGHLEACKTKYADNEFMKKGIDAAWLKLEKYYELTDDTPVYVVATVLNPMNKWAYFEQHWGSHPQWISTAKKAAKDFWNTNYKPAASSLPTPTSACVNKGFYAFYTRREGHPIVRDEWQRYLDADLHAVLTSKSWIDLQRSRLVV